MALLAGALVDLETAYDYLRQPPPEHKPRVVEAINRATLLMESRCRRRLLSRSYTGATALRVNGTGADRLYLPEWPPTAVASASDVRDGVTTVLDLTDAVFDEAGLLVLSADHFPSGTLNISVAATCGYLAGTHDDVLADLRGWCCEIATIFYQDWAASTGRAVESGPSSAGRRLEDRLPERICEGLRRYERVL